MAVTRTGAVQSGTTSVAYSGAVAVNDFMIVIANWAIGYTGAAITDTLGNVYTQRLSVHNTVNTYNDFLVFSSVISVPGTPTINMGGTNGQRIVALGYTGFVGVPQIIVADANQAQGAASTAVNSGNVIASVNNEHFISWFNDNGGNNPSTNAQFGSVGLGGFTMLPLNSLVSFPSGFTAGTVVNYSCTLGAADNWSTQIFGFYDGPLPSNTGYWSESAEYF